MRSRDLEAFLRRSILDRAPCIRHLTLHLGVEVLSFVTATLPPEAWAVLDKATLKRAQEFWSPYDHPNIKPIEELPIWKAPVLRHVEWESVEADAKLFPSIGPNYRRLESRETRMAVVPAQNGRNSVKLNDDGTEFLNDQLNTAPISLESPFVLKHPTIVDLSDTYINPLVFPVVFLDGLQLPALETLSYRLVCSRQGVTSDSDLAPLPHGDAHPLVSFLKSQKRPTRIKSFKIPSMSTISQDDFVECLKMMLLLEQLWVEDRRRVLESSFTFDPKNDVAPDSVLLRRLLPSGQDTLVIICPRLTSLRFDLMEDVTFDDFEAFVQSRLALADTFPLVHPICSAKSRAPTPASNSIVDGVARLKRIYIGMTTMKTDHVPRDYSPQRGRPSCALEEDLWELGVDTHLHLREADFDQDFRRWTNEFYDPRGGLGY